MKIHEILVENTTPDAPLNTFKAIVGSFVRELHSIAHAVEDRAKTDLRIARLMAGTRKAKWVNDNYYTSARFRSTGIQPSANLLSKRAKDPQVRAILKQLANIPISAKKESGRSKVFDIIGDYISQLGQVLKDKELIGLINQMNQAYEKLRAVLYPPKEEPVRAKAPKQPKNKLPGQQQSQAEMIFNQVVGGLPKAQQKRIRQDTQRMNPAQKLAYLKTHLG